MVQQVPREKVLIVDEDPDVLDLLHHEVLGSMGFQVEEASEAATAIQKALSFAPDLIIASLTLPGLSGKDLLVALNAQEFEVPVLVTADEGMEADAIQAFRLGARDYLVKPLREAEVVAAVERALEEIKLRHDKLQLARKLGQSNRELERRVGELTTISGLGKAVTSTTDLNQLFEKLMEGSLYVAEADMAWILLDDDEDGTLVMRAQRGVPDGVARKMHQPWEDGVSSLVMLSGEALRIDGEGLEKFKLARFTKSALITPIKVRDKPIGVINVGNKKANLYSERHQFMMASVADYASIALVNARLFRELEIRAEQLQQKVDRVQQLKDQPTDVSSFEDAVHAAIDDIQKSLAGVEDPALRSNLAALEINLLAVLDQLEDQPARMSQSRTAS